MLFGGQYKKKGLLSGFPSGMQQMQPVEAPMPAMGNPMAQMGGNMDAMSDAMAPKKPGINWLGVLADTLAGAAGQPGPYAAQQQRRRDEEFAARQQEQQREAGFADWQRKRQWDIDNPAPINNDTVNDYQFILQQSGPEAANQYLQSRYDPVVNIPLGDGRTYIGPRSGAPSAVQGMQGGGQGPDNDEWGPIVNERPGGVSGNVGGGFPVKSDFGAFSRAIISQESGGRYGVANTEGSGAMGVGQVMPDTARTLAARAGLPYRPDLMAGNSPEARAYQDKITEGALKEAWTFGGGDARRAAHYYFGGSDQKKWGGKTRRYGNDILGRLAKGGK